MNQILGGCKQETDERLLELDWFTEEPPKQLMVEDTPTISIIDLTQDQRKCVEDSDELISRGQNIQKYFTVLCHRYQAETKIVQKLQQLHEHLNIFEVELLIVKELIINCSKGPTDRLRDLKSIEQQNKEFKVKANSSAEVNLRALDKIYLYVRHDLFYRMEQFKRFINGRMHATQLLFEARVLYSELIMTTRTFGTVIDTPLDDLFCLDKSHPEWQSIRRVWESKQIADAKQMQQSYDTFTKAIRIGHAIVLKRNNFKNKFIRNLIFLLGGIWYFVQDQRTRRRAMTHTCILEPQSASEVMNLLELPGIKHLLKIGIPLIKTNKKIYIDPVVTPITPQRIVEQTQNGTLNKLTLEPVQLVNVQQHLSPEFKKVILQKCPQKIRIRILCHKELEEPIEINPLEDQNLKQNVLRKLTNLLGLTTKPQQFFRQIIVHIHGGGFIAMSSGSHQCYTRMWAKQFKIPIFSIDYGLAPKYAYPVAVDDCWQAYQWILNYVSKYFNVIPEKIIFAGDSAGGNLCCAVTGLAIKHGCKVPDGILLAYPVLDLKFKYTPSHILGLKDALLSHTVMDICLKAYHGYDHCDPDSDPFISPVYFSDEILSKFPKVRLMGGQLDPISDHAYRFAQRLIKNNIDVRMIEYQDIAHGFLSFYVIKGMKEVLECIKDSIFMIQELLK